MSRNRPQRWELRSVSPSSRSVVVNQRGWGTGGIVDTLKSFVWEPAVVKLNAVTAATEAACLVLSVDETVRNPRSEQPAGGMPTGGRGGMPMMGRGRGRGRGMGR